MSVIVRIALAVAVAASFVGASRTVLQHGDAYGGLVWAEADALLTGATVSGIGDDGQPFAVEQRCGLFGGRQVTRHYPPGATYLIAAGTALGLTPHHVPGLLIAASVALLVYAVGSLPVAALFAVAPWVSWGVGGFLSMPVELTFDFASMALLAAAALTGRPWALCVAGFAAGCLSRLVVPHAAVVLAFSVARWR